MSVVSSLLVYSVVDNPGNKATKLDPKPVVNVAPEVTATQPYVSHRSATDGIAAAVRNAGLQRVAAYLAAMKAKNDTAYYAGIQASRDAQAEAARKSAASRVSTPIPQQTSQPSVPAPTNSGGIPYSYALWMRVHNCEQPDTWHAGGHFGNGLPSAGGGLGFSLYAWQDAVRYAANRGVTLPSSMWNASIDQQMQGAQAMLDATGGGPACL